MQFGQVDASEGLRAAMAGNAATVATRMADAAEHFEVALELLEGTSDRANAIAARILLGSARCWLGRFKEGLDDLTAAADDAARGGFTLREVQARLELGYHLVAAGRDKEGMATLAAGHAAGRGTRRPAATRRRARAAVGALRGARRLPAGADAPQALRRGEVAARRPAERAARAAVRGAQGTAAAALADGRPAPARARPRAVALEPRAPRAGGRTDGPGESPRLHEGVRALVRAGARGRPAVRPRRGRHRRVQADQRPALPPDGRRGAPAARPADPRQPARHRLRGAPGRRRVRAADRRQRAAAPPSRRSSA